MYTGLVEIGGLEDGTQHTFLNSSICLLDTTGGVTEDAPHSTASALRRDAPATSSCRDSVNECQMLEKVIRESSISCSSITAG